MSARDIRAGKAFVEVEARDKVNVGLRSAMGKLKAFAKGAEAISVGMRQIGVAFTAAGASILGALGGFAKQFADVGSKLNDMSTRTGVSVESLSELKFAAEQTGASLEDVEAALKFMARSGLDVSSFDKIAAQIAGIQDPTVKAAAAMAAFGRGGAVLIPMLEQLQKLRAEARGAGLIISGAEAAKADALGDALDKIFAQIKAIGLQIGSAVAGPLLSILETISPIVAQTAQWVKENQGLFVVLAGVGAAALVIGGAFLAASTVVAIVGTAIAGLWAIIAALMTPIGAVVAGIALVAAGIATAAGLWVSFDQTAQAALGGIFSAIASGNLETAWATVVLTMQDLWLRMIRVVKAAFFELGRWVVGLFGSLLRDVGTMLNDAGAALGINLGGNSLTAFAQGIEGAFTATRAASIGATDAAIRDVQSQLGLLRTGTRMRNQAKVNQAMAGMAAVGGGTNDGSENQPFGRTAGTRGSAFGSFQGFGAELTGRAGESASEEKKQTGFMKEILAALKDGNGINQEQVAAIKDLEGLAFD